MKKTISLSILFVFLLTTFSIATNITIPTWSENTVGTTEVNAEPADNFLNIESESAILIEQSTRSSII